MINISAQSTDGQTHYCRMLFDKSINWFNQWYPTRYHVPTLGSPEIATVRNGRCYFEGGDNNEKTENGSTLYRINGQKPYQFPIGIWDRKQIGEEKNCSHVNYSGAIDLTTQSPATTQSAPDWFNRRAGYYGWDLYSSKKVDGSNGKTHTKKCYVPSFSPGGTYMSYYQASYHHKYFHLIDGDSSDGWCDNRYGDGDSRQMYLKWDYGDHNGFQFTIRYVSFANPTLTRRYVGVLESDISGGFVSGQSLQYTVTRTDYDSSWSVTHQSTATKYAKVIITSAYSVGATPTKAFVIDASKHYEHQLHLLGNALMDELDCSPPYDLVRSALEEVDVLDMNNIENASQLRDLKGLLPPIRDLKKWKKNPIKAASNLYLWYKYAIRTSIGDINKILENRDQIVDAITAGVDRNFVYYDTDYVTIDLLGVEQQVRRNVKLSVTPNTFTEVQKANHYLRSFGLDVSFANVWDLVPYSFVVDWFIGVGNFLECVDYAMTVSSRQYDLHYLTSSVKTVVRPYDYGVSLFDEKSSGVELSLYKRGVYPTFPRNEFRFGSGNPTRHILDGAALIIAR